MKKEQKVASRNYDVERRNHAMSNKRLMAYAKARSNIGKKSQGK